MDEFLQVRVEFVLVPDVFLGVLALCFLFFHHFVKSSDEVVVPRVFQCFFLKWCCQGYSVVIDMGIHFHVTICYLDLLGFDYEVTRVFLFVRVTCNRRWVYDLERLFFLSFVFRKLFWGSSRNQMHRLRIHLEGFWLDIGFLFPDCVPSSVPS